MGGVGGGAGDWPGPVQEPVRDTTAILGCSTPPPGQGSCCCWAELEVEAGKAEYGCTVPGEARQRGQDMGIIGDCGVQLSALPNPHTHTATTPSPG